MKLSLWCMILTVLIYQVYGKLILIYIMYCVLCTGKLDDDETDDSFKVLDSKSESK